MISKHTLKKENESLIMKNAFLNSRLEYLQKIQKELNFVKKAFFQMFDRNMPDNVKSLKIEKIDANTSEIYFLTNDDKFFNYKLTLETYGIDLDKGD